MERSTICAECGKDLHRTALVDLIITYEPDDEKNELFEQLWHKGCFVMYHNRQNEKADKSQ